MGGSQASGVATLTFALGDDGHELRLGDQVLACVEVADSGWTSTVGGRTYHADNLDNLLGTLLFSLGVATSYEQADALAHAVSQAWWFQRKGSTMAANAIGKRKLRVERDLFDRLVPAPVGCSADVLAEIRLAAQREGLR